MAKKRCLECWKTVCLDNEKIEEELPTLHYISLFRYSTISEKVGILCASLLAVISGGVPPVINIIYGEFCNLMIDRQYPSQTPYSDGIILPIFGGGKVLFNASDKERSEALMDDAAAWGYASGLLTFALFLFCMASVFLLSFTSARQISRIKVLYFKSILCKDLSWFDINMKGNFAGQSSQNFLLLERGMSDVLCVFIFHMSAGIINILISFHYGWLLAITLLGVVTPVVACVLILSRCQNRFEGEGGLAAMRAENVAEEAFTSVKTVVAFGGENIEIARYAECIAESKKNDIQKNITAGVSNGLLWFALYCSYSTAFAVGVRLIEASVKKEEETEYTPAVLLIIFFGIVTSLMSLGFATGKLGVLSTARTAGAIIFEIIDKTCIIDPCKGGGQRLYDCKGDIEFKQVYFEYPSRSGSMILKGLNLKVKAGQTVAIVGESGSGKSTVLNLLQRFYDPLKGSVLLDGRDLRQLNVSWLRSQFGVVGEEPILFSTSIRENISYGNTDATEEEIENAAKRACAYDFIMEFRDGFRTEVGQQGSSLSGGQRQRIAIARVLVGNPKILVLDEATRTLDVTTESLVRAELNKAAVGRTTLIITHRLSTVTNADRIVVLANGVIVEEGTHAELMKANGPYKRLLLTEGEESRKVPKKKVPSMYRVGSPVNFTESTLLPPGPRGRLNSVTGVPRTSGGDFYTAVERVKEVNFPEIVRWTRPELTYFLIGSLASIICGITLPVLCILYGDLVGLLAVADFSFMKRKTDEYASILVCVGLVTGVCVYVQLHCFGIAAAKLCSRLKIKAFKCLIYQEIAFFEDESNSAGTLCMKLSRDPAGIQGTFDIRLGVLLQAVTAMTIGIVLSFIYNVKITLVTLTTIPFLFAGVYVESIFATGLLAVENKSTEKSSKIAKEVISGIKTVASLAQESVFVQKYADGIKEGDKTIKERFWMKSFAFAVGQAAPYFGYAVTLWYGGRLVAEEQVVFRDVIKIAELLIFGTWTLGQSLVFGPSLRETRAAAGRLQYIFTRTPKVVDGLSDLPADVNTKTINFSKVHFAYSASGFALQNLNLRIEPGKRTTVMGASGSGKSSIIPLLLRFYDPISGTVAIGRTNLRACRLSTLRRKFGVVSQRAHLFDRSVKENIAYGDNTRIVSLDEIIDAAKAANIHPFILSLPRGYDTKLGPGTHLSGGEKQRIAIARILVRNPDILLLDEATLGLDPENESMVQNALDSISAGRTTLTIAHRLSGIKSDDMIHVLEKGTLKESGTRDELLQRKGLFYKMYSDDD